MNSPVASGLAGAAASLAAGEIKELVRKFKNREVGFIQDEKNIALANEVKKGDEWNICKEYVVDKELKLLVRMGLTLRRLERDQLRMHDLRDKIKHKHGSKGLHVAQFVQNGILWDTLSYMIEEGKQKPDIIVDIESLLHNIDGTTKFIKADRPIDKVVRELTTKIEANSPPFLILFGSGNAIPTVDKIIKKIIAEDLGYSEVVFERGLGEKKKRTVFLVREPVNGY